MDSSTVAMNITTTDDLSEFRGLMSRYCIGVAIPIVSLVGLVGNLLNILTLSTSPAMARQRASSTMTKSHSRSKESITISISSSSSFSSTTPAPTASYTSMYTYLRCMAVSDIAACLLWIPEALTWGWKVRYHHYAIAFYFAHLSFPILNWAIISSAFLVLSITIDRFLVICFPMKARTLISRGRVRLAVFLSYLIPFLLYLPKTLEYEPYYNLEESRYAVRLDREYVETYGFKTYVWIRTFVVTILPMILIISVNTATICVYKRENSKTTSLITILNEDHRNLVKSRRDGEKYLVRLLIAASSVYIVCYAPMAAHFLHRTLDSLHYSSANKSAIFYRIIVQVIELTNSAANFYIYCLVSSVYRQALKITMRKYSCGGCRQNEVKNYSNNITSECNNHKVLTGDSFKII